MWGKSTTRKGMCFACYNRLKQRKTENNPKRKEYQKEYYQKHKELYNKLNNEHYYENKEKRLRTMKDTYKTKKEECEECGSKENLENHHLDYSDNPKIEILCRKCHRRKHRK